MYEDFYELRERPFELTADPRYLFLTKKHREGLSAIRYGLSERKPIVLLTGEPGTGKTMLAQALLHQQEEQTIGSLLYLNNPTVTRREFYEQIAAGFGIDSTAPTPRLLEELRTMLRELRHAGQPVGLIVDEAHELSDELLREVRLLSNLETPTEKLLPIVLIGQSTLAERLNQPAWWQLKQRIALRFVLAPLDLVETAAYISSRIEVAGGRSIEVFTRDAVLAIHEASGGLARTINVLCDNALLSGFAAGERPVGRQIVLEICRDFDLEPAQPAAARAPTDTQPETTAAPAENPSTALITFRTQPFDASLARGLPAAAPVGTTSSPTESRSWLRRLVGGGASA